MMIWVGALLLLDDTGTCHCDDPLFRFLRRCEELVSHIYSSYAPQFPIHFFLKISADFGEMSGPKIHVLILGKLVTRTRKISTK